MTPSGTQCRLTIQTALENYDLPSTESAIRLLCMIAAHESGGFSYVKQVNGPALSLFQVEPPTFTDVLDYASRRQLLSGDDLHSPPERLIFDSSYASAIGRIFFMRFPEPLPDPDNIVGLSVYAKDYWNTHMGKATPELYEEAYREWFE